MTTTQTHLAFPNEAEEVQRDLLSIKEASRWATVHLNKTVTESNISYLIQYGRVKKHSTHGATAVSRTELEKYYNTYFESKEKSWTDKLGGDLNWQLSFDSLKEAETTKHVHRLHPYKGKFIPQLVEYFLDDHTDSFKKAVYFKRGDILLDPFAGSGTTLVQANELGMHAIGVDVSAFNALISNIKIGQHDIAKIGEALNHINQKLKTFLMDSHTVDFEEKLSAKLTTFNNKFFPSSDFKYRVQQGEIDEDAYGSQREKEFLPIYQQLVEAYHIRLLQPTTDTFLDKWYLQHIRAEIEFVYDLIKQVPDADIQKILCVILSRTIRSCRATTHADLATLKEPITATYYCAKHHKICKPLFSIKKWWEKYGEDTLERLVEFSNLRTATHQVCLTGDSREIDVFGELAKQDVVFVKLVKAKKINGIFSSPPYVGLIDYHEQHAYAYDLFGFKRNDALEIGAMGRGQGKEARLQYAESIASVLNNSKPYLVEDYNIFLVANDKYNLYPLIAEKAGMKIVNQYKRPVLNRTEKDKGAYSEIIFHLKSV
jgi:hypothetical protein